MAKQKILLSACLAGVNCVYDGTNKFHPVFAEMHKKAEVLLFCPEALGGLKIPHSPSEISGARVLSREGRDVTAYFLEGAKRSLELAKKYKIKKAILKSKSPSCGCGWVFDGTFSKKLVPGFGVTAALLKKSGIAVCSDVEYLEKKKRHAQKSGK